MKISEREYLASFPPDKRSETFKYAIDTRKFEIELYWKRATYFWTFIAATLAGYSAIQVSSSVSDKTDLSVILSCLGVLFSFGWHCVNRGSKQWQENWENHVDMLESDVVGPLFKTVLRRRKPIGIAEQTLEIATGPWAVSVSGINQIISIFVVILWAVLLLKSLHPFSFHAPFDFEHLVLVSGTLLCCVGFVTAGRTYKGTHGHTADLRESQIEPLT
ncbi:RipA family octameric membrane protein [Xanthomonas axonopodis]